MKYQFTDYDFCDHQSQLLGNIRTQTTDNLIHGKVKLQVCINYFVTDSINI